MRNKLIVLAGAVALTAFSTVQATQITGIINMSGTATLDTQYLVTSTKATALSSVTVSGGPTLSFAGTATDPVTWNPFVFSGANPTFNGVSTPLLWQFTDSTTHYTYSFALASDYISQQTGTSLDLLGTGTLYITGTGSPYDVGGTTGAWSFTITDPNGGQHTDFQFSFANSQVGVVPDGGATVMLLGAALSAMGLFRKKLIA